MATQEEEQLSTFSLITDALVNLGAFPLSKFADPAFVTSLYQPGANGSSQTSPNNSNHHDMDPHEALTSLNINAQALFGNASCLHYQIHGEGNPGMERTSRSLPPSPK